MQQVYNLDESDSRKLAYLYKHSGIETRYSVIPDYGKKKNEWKFFDPNLKMPMPDLEERLALFEDEAVKLSVKAIKDCIASIISPEEITHLITVSCTGMRAPGLDLSIVENLKLNNSVFRTSVNFMGCYAAVHALKIAKLIGENSPNANIVIVATELCTLHFQSEYNLDNASSSLLFADGSAAVLLQNKQPDGEGLKLENFFSSVAFTGKEKMSWDLSSKGFLMTLSPSIPDIIEAEIEPLITDALKHYKLRKNEITHWCIHPGGKRILEVIKKKLNLSEEDLCFSKDILLNYGNMSSPTILFILKKMMPQLKKGNKIITMAFGPGLTMETALLQKGSL